MNLDGLSPELVWGLLPRFVGFLYVLAFAALIPQVDITLGSRGLLPIKKRPYAYRFMPTFPKSRAPFCAPHHPRLDQALYYAAFGVQDASFFGSLVGDGNPYRRSERGRRRALLVRSGP